MSRIEETYRAATPKSARCAERAEAVMPGGDTRSTTYHRPYPLAIARGEGPFLWDVRRQPLYRPARQLYEPRARQRLPADLRGDRGRIAQRHGLAGALGGPDRAGRADLRARRVGGARAVLQFGHRGRDARGAGRAQDHRAQACRDGALRLSRLYDDFEVGLAGHDGERTLLADYGDADAFEQILAARGSEIAAVFLEPVMGSAGIVTPPEGFLQSVAAAARRAGALFVIDEVITLRLATGGAQSIAGVRPDLTMMGKIIGGGLPVGALGGSEAVMAAFDPRGRTPLWHAGTFNGNQLTCSAGAVSIRELTAERIAAMDRLARRLASEMGRAAEKAGLPFSARQAGSLLNIFFMKEPPPATISRADSRAIRMFHLAALNRGLFIAPRGLIAFSTVIDDQLTAEICERAGSAIADLAQEPGARESQRKESERARPSR